MHHWFAHMSAWIQVAENLVRHEASGIYYLRVKVAGKIIRRTLGTKSLRAAKSARDKKILELKAIAGAAGGAAVRSMADALALVESRNRIRPGLKSSTRAYHQEILGILKKGLPAGAARWGKIEVERWWGNLATRYAGPRANACLGFLRQVYDALVESGVRGDNPAAGLKRAKVKESDLTVVPSREDMQRIIEDIRGQRKRVSEESANMVAFLAWSGMRVGEVQSLWWKHVGEEWIDVVGGEEGTKNRRMRRVPISAPLREVIERMRWEGAAGPVFHLRSPRGALRGACRRLDLPHLRVHDLRHTMATRAIESGVSIPTVSKWLGHRDGGALAMRVYGRTRDDHSLAEAGKL